MTSANRENVESLLDTCNITSAPVDIIKIASLCKLQIKDYPLPDEMSAYIHIDDQVRFIVVNSNHSPTRQRFSICHELGHFMCGHSYQDKQTSQGTERYYDKHFQQEKEADRFASELLIPKKFISKDVGWGTIDVDSLAEKYNVSKEAMEVRLSVLKLFSRNF